MSIALAGFALGMSLIVAMGPQNILLLKHGIRREGITAVILVCLLSDVILFTAGTLGVGVLTESFPVILAGLRWAGVIYLGWFALVSFRDALRPRTAAPRVMVDAPAAGDDPDTGGTAAGRGGTGVATLPRVHRQTTAHGRTWVKPMLIAIAVTWINPGAYLDSLVMIGGMANQYGETGRWWFIGGCLTASLVWFTGVGYGAGSLSEPLSSPKVWRALNVIFGVILVALAAKLAVM